jgi:hypothetical protein
MNERANARHSAAQNWDSPRRLSGRFVVVLLLILVGCGRKPSADKSSAADESELPLNVEEAIRDVAARQSQALKGATTLVHRVFRYDRTGIYKPSADEQLVAVDVEFRKYSKGLDLDDVDLVDGDTDENYGSDPEIKRLRPDGKLDTNSYDDHAPSKPLRVLLIYRLPKEVASLQLEYWGDRLTEAAIPIVEGKLEVDDSHVVAGVEFWPYPDFSHYLGEWQREHWLIVACVTGEGAGVIDTAAWPPSIERWNCNLLSAIEPAPEGGWVVITRTGHTRDDIRFPIWLHPAAVPGKSEMPADAPAADPHLRGIVVSGEAIFAYNERNFFRFADGRLSRVPEMPEAQGVKGRHGQNFTHGQVRLAGDKVLAIWDGYSYEFADGRWSIAWPERIDEPHELSTVPWGDDGFYYVSGRQVFRQKPGTAPQQVMAGLENVMAIAPGPEGSIVFRQGDNPAGQIGGVWFPDGDNYVPLRSDEISGELPSGAFDGLYWVAASDRWYVTSTRGAFTLPADRLLDRPRKSLPSKSD